MFKIVCKASLFVSFLGCAQGKAQYKLGQMVHVQGWWMRGCQAIITDVEPAEYTRNKYTILGVRNRYRTFRKFILREEYAARFAMWGGEIRGWSYPKGQILVLKTSGHREFVRLMEKVHEETDEDKRVMCVRLARPGASQTPEKLEDLYLPEDFFEINYHVFEGNVLCSGKQPILSMDNWIKRLARKNPQGYAKVFKEKLEKKSENCTNDKREREKVVGKYNWETPATRAANAPAKEGMPLLWIIIIVLLVLCACGAIFFVMRKSKAKEDPDAEQDKVEQDDVEQDMVKQDNVKQDEVEQDNDIEEGQADEL